MFMELDFENASKQKMRALSVPTQSGPDKALNLARITYSSYALAIARENSTSIKVPERGPVLIWNWA